MMNYVRRLSSKKKPLVENNENNNNINNNSTSNGCPQASVMNFDDASSQSSSISADQRRRQSLDQTFTKITLGDLANYLLDSPNSAVAEDGRYCSEHPELVVGLVEKHVTENFQKLDVDQDLSDHLSTLKKTVYDNLTKQGPLFQHHEQLVGCYHRHTFRHLETLLETVRTTKNSLVLMKWVMKTYLSEDLLAHPELKELEPMRKVDFLLFTEWVQKAKDKLLKLTQKHVSDGLDKILKNEDDELYVDTIQFIDAIPKEAQKISPKLSRDLQEVCFKELQTFLTSYTAKQKEILSQISATQEMKPIFKILNNCHHIKKHVQTEAKDVEVSPLKETMEETVTTLEHLEDITMKCLTEIIADITKKHLQKYFKSDNRGFHSLINEVHHHFSELSSYQDVQTSVMDKVYKLIAQIYFELLIKSDRKKLTKFWFAGVEETVGETVGADAEFLHSSSADLAPGVGQWNKMLLEVKDLLECRDLEAMKVTVAIMQRKCSDFSEELQLLHPLLRWKGLSKKEVKEVLGIMTSDLPGYQPKSRAASWSSCIRP